MKNKNQKEIDMIVGIMDKINPWDCKTWPNYYKKCAEEILTRLKEKEIVLAKGEIEKYKDIMFINDIDLRQLMLEIENELYSYCEKNLGKNIILKVVIEDE